MKNRFARLSSALLAVMLLVLTLLAFNACADKPSVTIYFENGEEVKTFTVKIEDYEEGATLYDVLKQDKSLEAVMDETTTPFVTSMCGVTPDASANEYISIYTSLADKAWGEDTIEKHGTTFYTSGYGVAELPLTDGAVYLFCIESWS